MAASTTEYYKGSQLGKKRLALQNFHNWIKRELINSVSREGAAYLDLSCGRGGDVNKWQDKKYSLIIGIDIAGKDLIKARDRAKMSKLDVTFLHGDFTKPIFPNMQAFFEDSKQLAIQYFSVKHQFDIISCQFAIHYFFKDTLILRTFLLNVSENIKKGGHFIGTFFDGHRILKAIEKDRIDIFSSTKLFEIKPISSSTINSNGIICPGYEISVYNTMYNNTVNEWLVDFDYLVEIAAEYGLKLVSLRTFEDYYKEYLSILELGNKRMSPPEKLFSFLCASFDFIS